jgi:pimeloyl-ACP methyl ester carboxylesterase
MSNVPAPELEGTIRLRDGRRLGFAAFGDHRAKQTIFWNHGTPGARRQIPLDARRYAAERGVRVIGIDRPGVGLSDPHVYDNVLGFAFDLMTVADTLAVESLHVVGLSGGGPYSLATAVAMPERVKGVGVLGGVAPSVGPDAIEGGLVGLVRPLVPLVVRAKAPLGVVLGAVARMVIPFGSQAFELYRAVQPPGDRRLMADPDFKAMFIDDLSNGARHQFSAMVSDAIVFSRDWGFRLADVDVPVRWWHGVSDHIVPFAHGEHAVARLPNAELIQLGDEAHLGGLGLASDIIGVAVPAQEVIEEVLEAES